MGQIVIRVNLVGEKVCIMYTSVVVYYMYVNKLMATFLETLLITLP